MTDETNIVMFPVERIRIREDENGEKIIPPQSLEEVQGRIDTIRHFHIQETLNAISETIMQQLVVAGFDINSEELNKDIVFSIESIRSLMCKTQGVFHPLQELSQKTFKRDEEDESLELVDRISLTFSQKEIGSKKPKAKKKKAKA